MKNQFPSNVAVAAIVLSLCSAGAMAGPLSLIGDTDKSPITYKAGEKMVFKIQLLEDESKPVDGRKLKWERRGDDQKTENGKAVSSAANPLTIETSIAVPSIRSECANKI